MVDFSSLANVLARAERETTLCVLQAQLAFATSRRLLARVATQRTLLCGPSFDVCAGNFTTPGLERLAADRGPVGPASDPAWSDGLSVVRRGVRGVALQGRQPVHRTAA